MAALGTLVPMVQGGLELEVDCEIRMWGMLCVCLFPSHIHMEEINKLKKITVAN